MRIYEFCVSIWNLNYIENFVLASLPCYLFVFVSLFVMIILYMGADAIAGNIAPKWATGGCGCFNLNALFVFKLLKYILKSLWIGIFFFYIYNYEIVIYIYSYVK